MADITTKYKSKWTGKEIDEGIEKAKNAVPLDGSKAMTGSLLVSNGTAAVSLGIERTLSSKTYKLLELLANVSSVPSAAFDFYEDGTWYSRLALQKSALKLKLDGASTYADVLHTGNKPSGSYTGNGSATSRTIETGGIGNVIAIWSTEGKAIIGKSGGLSVYSTSLINLTAGSAKFTDGVLTLATTDVALNKSGVTYGYQVL